MLLFQTLLCCAEHDASNHFKIADLHPLLVHFPIVLFFVALVFDLLSSLRKDASYRTIAHWTVIIAALIAIPTVITGLFAAKLTKSPFVEIHGYLGITTLAYSLLHAILRIYALRAKKRLPSALFLVAILINVGLVGITAEYGGAVVRGRGLFLHAPEPAPKLPS
jgi:uncharacterized membrane protein